MICTLTDTGEDSKLVHRRKRPKVDTLFSSLFSDASERRVWLSAESKILAFTFGRFRLYRLKGLLFKWFVFLRLNNCTLCRIESSGFSYFWLTGFLFIFFLMLLFSWYKINNWTRQYFHNDLNADKNKCFFKASPEYTVGIILIFNMI